MRTGIVAFLSGNLGLLYAARLPDPEFLFFLFGLLLCLLGLLYKSCRKYAKYIPKYCLPVKIFAFFLLGYVYTAFLIHLQTPTVPVKEFEGKTLVLEGQVIGIPLSDNRRQRFDFMVSNARYNRDKPLNGFRGRIRLSWYQTKIPVANDQQWRFEVRLKRPNGYRNPGGFDYEKYLFQNHIIATGYVRNSSYNRLLGNTTSVNVSPGRLRHHLNQILDTQLQENPYKGLYKALALGIRSDLSPQHWKLFFETGTNHLVAISGLHIGLLAGMAWLIVAWSWRSIYYLNSRYAAQYASAIAALSSAVVYAGLAGFAIPTQRALLMLTVVFAAKMLKRELPSSHVLALSLLLVLLFDPRSSLSPGFWLSFTAVAVILLVISGRLRKNLWLNRLGRLQWYIFIGLIPVLGILFNQLPLVSPLANIIAVPLMSLVIVPLTLAGTAASLLSTTLSGWIFVCLDYPVQLLFWLLDGIKTVASPLILPDTGLLPDILAVCGTIWLLMPAGWPLRWAGLFLLLPALLNQPATPSAGEVQMTVLDVGQGLAIVVRTQHHALLFDTGDRYSENFNMASQVIVPFARYMGVPGFDRVIVSHGDSDHAGALNDLLSGMKTGELFSGEPERLLLDAENAADIRQCKSGQHWRWDNVDFRILSPVTFELDEKSNNRSCVLLVSTPGYDFLLTGDIEKRVELELVKAYPGLDLDVLVVPHHGSKTSSSLPFLTHFKPEIAIFSYGFRNRYRFPHPRVSQRYDSLGINSLNSTNGAIDIKTNISNNSLLINQFRYDRRYFWHRRPE